MLNSKSILWNCNVRTALNIKVKSSVKSLNNVERNFIATLLFSLGLTFEPIG